MTKEKDMNLCKCGVKLSNMTGKCDKCSKKEHNARLKIIEQMLSSGHMVLDIKTHRPVYSDLVK